MRNKLGFNKSQLSQCIQSTPSIIGEIESGKREPSKNILIKLLSMYNVNINWLLSGEGEMFIANSKLAARRPPDVSVRELGATSMSYLETKNNGFYSKYLLHDCGHVAEDSTGENSPKELDLIKIDNIVAREKETAILIPEVFNIYREKLTAIAITSDDMQPTISKNAIILCNDFGFVGAGIYAVKINGVYSVKRISLKNT